MKLEIGRGLALPEEAVTQTFAILAKRGVGKTYTASVMTEEMLKAGLPVVAIDPIGVWWGLRASADGKREGLEIIVFGGDHGDVPLEKTAGQVLADLIVDERLSCVLDLSRFRKGEQIRFMTDFAERLYHRNREPLHLMIDEADSFAPQKTMKGEGAERLLGAIEDLVRRGRARGLGMTLVTQRPAVLNKNVLTQVEVLVALRTVSPQDRTAIDDWVKVYGEPGQREEVMESLASLEVGESWWWSPGWLDLFKRVRVRERETFDSSATPKSGQRRAEPKRLADVDLDAVRDKIAATIERAKADDPKELRRRIAELQKEIRDKPQPEPERVEVPVLEPEHVGELRDLLGQVSGIVDSLVDVARTIDSRLSKLQSRPTAQPRQAPSPSRQQPRREAPRAQAPAAEGDAQLRKAERTLLSVLAQFPDGRTKTQLAILGGYSAKGGGFNNAIGRLRSLGYVTPAGVEPIRATQEGIDAAGDVEPIPTGQELYEHWQRQLKKAERAILDVLYHTYPQGLTKEEIAEQAGYEPSGGGFNNALGKLRTLELAVGYGEVFAAEALFEEITAVPSAVPPKIRPSSAFACRISRGRKAHRR